MKRGIEAHTAGFTDSGGAVKAWEPPTPAELAGQFAGMEVLELLGRGGMGAVYKARQKQLDRVVALKILPPDIGQDPAFAERFAREAKALARLSHPNIVTLYEFGCTSAGLYYFLMEYVDGVSLRRLMDAGRVEPREALAIVPQVCDALQYAHDQGIVHRDIKPENILLDRRGRVKVADFGLAMIAGQDDTAAGEVVRTGGAALTEAGKVVGTPRYMAPEQAMSPGNVDHRADIYALGVVFYQMLTGELPGRPAEAPSHIVRVDVRLDEVVLRALEREPGLRYAQASVMKTQVEAIAQAPAAAPETPALAAARGTRLSRHAGGIFSLRNAAITCFVLAIVFPLAAVLLSRLAPVHYSVQRSLHVFRSAGSTKEVDPAAVIARADQLRAAYPGASVHFTRGSDILTVSVTGRSLHTTADRADSLAAKIEASLRRGPGTDVAVLEGKGPTLRASSQHASFLLFGVLCSLLSCIAGTILLLVARFRGPRPQDANRAHRRPRATASETLPAAPPVVTSHTLYPPDAPLGHVAFFCACMSGVIPTIFYWLAPWLVPSLTPRGQELALWVTLAAALLGVSLGFASRRSPRGRHAMFVGAVSLTIWLMFFVIGNVYGPLPRTPDVSAAPSVAPLAVSPLQAAGPAEAKLRIELSASRGQLLELLKTRSDRHPTVIEIRRSIAALEREIEEVTEHPGESLELANAKAALRQVSQAFGSNHPKVLALENTVRELEHRDGLPSSQPATQSAAFDPAIDRALNYQRTGAGHDVLCLSDGRMQTLPPGFFERSEASNRAWLTADGPKVFMGFGNSDSDNPLTWNCGIVAATPFVLVPNHWWNGVSRDSLEDALRRTETGMHEWKTEGAIAYLLPGKTKPPVTMAFRTTDGRPGLFQIVNFASDDLNRSQVPLKLEVRYKLARQTPEKPATTKPLNEIAD